ncbi:MAG: hypothetical protein QOD96_7494, partial [Pseudonocardiales bacterium]|nr:hypothetical protein [Pseudonocardiales bacterium]
MRPHDVGLAHWHGRSGLGLHDGRRGADVAVVDVEDLAVDA